VAAKSDFHQPISTLHDAATSRNDCGAGCSLEEPKFGLCLKYGSSTSRRMFVFVVVYFLIESNLPSALSSFLIFRTSVEAVFPPDADGDDDKDLSRRLADRARLPLL